MPSDGSGGILKTMEKEHEMNKMAQKEKKVFSADCGERKDGDEYVELSLQAVLETARAVQHIRTLEKLNAVSIDTAEGRVTMRTAVVDLAELCCDPRRIIALMLYAADHPDWAWVNFWAVFCPEMSIKQMAKLRKINSSTVLYHLNQTELPSDAYDFIPENH